MPSAVQRKPHPRAQPRLERSIRSDGAETREHILQVAGNLFAEQGFLRTTSREICTQAGVNMAAVNYHFGGKDGLYDAVLVEAHSQLVRLDELEEISASRLSHEAKLRTVIGLFVRRTSGTTLPWGLSVLIHELIAPSTHVPVLMRQAVLPKIQVVASVIAGVLRVPEEHPLVRRAVALVILPCIMLVIAPREIISVVMPTIEADPDGLVDDMTSYAMAGLRALGRLEAETGRASTSMKLARTRRAAD